MKTLSAAVLVLAAVVALVGVSGSAPVPAQPPAPVAAWEYKVLYLAYGDPAGDEKRLNDLGAAGWEITDTVVVQRGNAQAFSSDSRVILRRPKR